MITITSYIFDFEFDAYHVKGFIEVFPYNYGISSFNAETNGEWDKAKSLAYLNARETELLQSAKAKYARDHNLTVGQLDKIEHPHFKLEWDTYRIKTNSSQEWLGSNIADDFLIQSPEMPKDAKEARTQIDAEMIKPKKSLGKSVQSLYKIIEDLEDRVKKMEITTIKNIKK